MATVSLVTYDSPYLNDVKSLWRQNSQTLGFYPVGAFEERAKKSQIIGAFENGTLVGYVLYYTTKSPCVRISHLCVAESYRGGGIARALISELQISTKTCKGIGLYCRRDYPSWRIWPSLGFHAIKEKIGHSKDGHELTFFIFTGEKTIELRRKRPRSKVGDWIAVYSTTPERQLRGIVQIKEVRVESLECLWSDAQKHASVTKEEYDTYFCDADRAVGIVLENPIAFRTPISLADLRHVWPRFQPPQGFRYLNDDQTQYVKSFLARGNRAA